MTSTFRFPEWVVPWVFWCVTGRKRHLRPSGAPKYIPVRFMWVPAWVVWQRAGRPDGKRPTKAPRNITRDVPWAWEVLSQVNRAVRVSLPTAPVPSPRPYPVTNPFISAAQNVIFGAQEPIVASRASLKYKIALTADPAYAEHSSAAVIGQFKDQGRPIYAWSDCHATPAQAAIEMSQRHSLNGWIGEAESQAALDHALDAGAYLLIGNPNSWSNDGRLRVIELVNAGRLAVIAEVYTNVAGGWPDEKYQGHAWDSKLEKIIHTPVHAICLGMGAYDGGKYISVFEYLVHTPAEFRSGIGIYHAAGMADGDWSALP